VGYVENPCRGFKKMANLWDTQAYLRRESQKYNKPDATARGPAAKRWSFSVFFCTTPIAFQSFSLHIRG
jgi:hypothetical protein